MIEGIKSIPLAAFLSRLGHEPAARKGTRLWYRSPLRHEQTPSFKVDTALNCWYDFGLGKGGNIIDLAAELYQSTDLRYLMRCIANSYPVPSVQTVASSFPHRHSAPSMERIEVMPLKHSALVAYLQERGIPAHIAKANCKEVHYSINGSSRSAFGTERRKKPYFAVAFENVSGGWELRNRYFKGCRRRKDISYLPWSRDGPSTECVVFEGFLLRKRQADDIDYLSALALGIISGADAIILNSVVNVNKAVPYLKGYTSRAGMSRSEYVREGALNATVVGVLSDEEKMLLHELKKLGPNLNQIAHRANAEGYRSVADKAENIVDCIAGFVLKLKNRMKT